MRRNGIADAPFDRSRVVLVLNNMTWLHIRTYLGSSIACWSMRLSLLWWTWNILSKDVM